MQLVARPALALIALLASSAVAQTPKTVAEVPLYTGATRVQVDASEFSESTLSSPESGKTLPVRSREVVGYDIAAHPEAVYAFYRQRLGGKTEYGMEETDFTRLSRGMTSPVIRGENFHNMDDEPGDLGIEAVSAAKKRGIVRTRPPMAGNQWFSDGGFDWMVREANMDVTQLSVHISDEGLKKWTTYTPRTRLVIVRTTYVDPEKADAAADEAARNDRRIAIQKDAESLGAGPSEAALGVALYPGSTFDARNSAGMSRGETSYYFYLSNDAPAVVTKFYTERMGRAPTDLGTDGQAWLIEGRMPFPRHAVFVAPNTKFPGGARTLITVVKAKQ